MPNTGIHEGLRQAIQQAGYYPALVEDALRTALAGEPPLSFIVHHEPHFDRDEIRRHCSVLVLTPTRLVVGHTDEYPSDESHPLPYATTSTEAVPLDRISSVVVSRTVTSPASYNSGDPGPRGGVDRRVGGDEPGRPRAGGLRRSGVRGRSRVQRVADL